MKKIWLMVLVAGLLVGPGLSVGKTPKSKEERLSYSIGVDIGRRLKSQSLILNPDLLAQGLRDSTAGTKLALSDQDMRDTMLAFRKEMEQKIKARREMKQKADPELAKQAKANLEQAKTFLAKNKTQPGIKTTKSGLQYQIIRPGKGNSPKPENKVVVNYRGTLLDGTEFDSSYARKKPAEFGVKGVIKGWTEALQMMQPGAKWKVFIPPHLAYGARRASTRIGPNSALIFEMELLEIK